MAQNPNNLIVYQDGSTSLTFEQLVKEAPPLVQIINDPSSLTSTLTGVLNSPSNYTIFSAPASSGTATTTVAPTSVTDIFTAFVSQYTGSGTGNTWTNFSQFLASWHSFTLYDTVNHQVYSALPTAANSNGNALYNYFYTIFLNRQGINIQAAGAPSGITLNDWMLLPTPNPPFPTPPPNGTLPTDSTSVDPTANTPFNAMMNSFFTNFIYPPAGTLTSVSLAPFMSQLDAFFGTTATIMPGMTPSFTGANPSLNPVTSLPSYFQIYLAFGNPNANLTQFQAALQTFYNSCLLSFGYFDASQFYNLWIQTVQSQNNTLSPYVNGTTSLAGNDSDKTMILNQIILLLIEIITTLQQASVAQANRLQFYTQFQNVYTQLMNQVPVFTIGGPFLGGTDTYSGQARNTLNTSFNANITDNLRSLRDIQQNNAQEMQTYINQSTDQVNQQSDMCTSFIQELSTLLTSIFR